MSYLLRIYMGDALFEQELELHKIYRVGSKKDSDILLPELELDFTVEACEKTWHGDSKDKNLHLAFEKGADQALQKIVYWMRRKRPLLAYIKVDLRILTASMFPVRIPSRLEGAHPVI